jgi:hypothetical protein
MMQRRELLQGTTFGGTLMALIAPVNAAPIGTEPLADESERVLQDVAKALGGRTAEGRYTLTLMATTLIMRPDLAQGYIGPPFDNR